MIYRIYIYIYIYMYIQTKIYKYIYIIYTYTYAYTYAYTYTLDIRIIYDPVMIREICMNGRDYMDSILWCETSGLYVGDVRLLSPGWDLYMDDIWIKL